MLRRSTVVRRRLAGFAFSLLVLMLVSRQTWVSAVLFIRTVVAVMNTVRVVVVVVTGACVGI
jgi:hypothetical protein